ncbi:MAG: hypothetical protein PUP92_12535 [Rhizonema sp. PD38]|nr:hypothetical protein [Rhizonema sp. PD38]
MELKHFRYPKVAKNSSEHRKEVDELKTAETQMTTRFMLNRPQVIGVRLKLVVMGYSYKRLSSIIKYQKIVRRK